MGWSDSVVSTVYDTIPEHFGRNQLAALIRKYPFTQKEFPFDRSATAWKKFLAAEELCRDTNVRLSDASFRSSEIESMRRFISYVIGEKPHLPSIYKKCSFGPGASIGVGGNATNLGAKLRSERWSVTRGALPYARAALAQDQHVWEFLLGNPVCFDIDLFHESINKRVEVVVHNKIAFVPKTATTDRSIAVEPLLNGYIQKGIDEYLRLRLKRIGIDLSSQSLNQEFAKDGSLNHDCDDPFCTIDLSSASDTISLSLAKRILPFEWFLLLNSCRSSSFLSPDGSIVRYHKLASMGNGFTFPIETLIFSAAIKAIDPSAVPARDFIVYGDDIVVRRSVALQLIPLLRDIGFQTNSNKTFIEGPFRESCGSDYFGGVDVRPIALNYRLDSVENIFKFLNACISSEIVSHYFSPIRDSFIRSIPHIEHWFTPYKCDPDSCVQVPLDVFMASPGARWDRDKQCWSWNIILHSAKSDRISCSIPTLIAMAAVRGSSSDKPYTCRAATRPHFKRVANAGTSSTWVPNSW